MRYLLRQQLLARGIACSINQSTFRVHLRNDAVSFDVMVYAQDLDHAMTYLRRVKVNEEAD